MKKIVLLMVFVLAAWGAAFAEDAKDDPLSLRTEGYVVRTEMKDGKKTEKLIELPKEVTPGETVQYNLVGKNTSDKGLKQVDVVGAIPKGTAYMDKSAKGPAEGSVKFSIDGGKTYAKPPIKEKVVRPGGKVEEREVPASRYTNVKFIVDRLGAGKEFLYTYRVEVK